ncbi:MAG: S-layer homology domain-containing protein [Clostridiales bacterium]|nr:S-layer homology domain-containing protein [Clostridiales bacterium]
MLTNSKIAKPALVWLLVICLVPLGFCFDASAGSAYAATDISRGEFVSEITGFFGWPHWDEYNDIWKDDPKTFDDVSGNAYKRAIEAALEEGVVGPKGYVGKRSGGDGKKEWGTDVVGSFKPDDPITREDAAVMLARAFKLNVSDINSGYDDNAAFSGDEARGSVAALAKLGLLGAVAGNFNPASACDRDEVLALFAAMKNGVVSPVYFIPRPTTGYAPRRNIKLYTANPAAEIYVSRNLNGALNTAPGGRIEPGDPVKSVATRYSEYSNLNNDAPRGYIGYDIGGSNYYQYPVIKAFAVDPTKALKTESEITRGDWNVWRPAHAPFQHELIFEKGALGPNSPAVYRLFERSDSVLAMAWYVEGSEYAIVNDALNLSQANTNAGGYENLKNYVINHVTSPGHPLKDNPQERLHLVIGHSDGDHTAQVYAFAGHRIYGSTRYSNATNRVVNGDTINLGDSTLTVYELPGHNSNSIILQDKESGLIFGSDIYACTRAGSVDDVGISNLRSDLFLSIIQQTHAMMLSDGNASYITTGHDEAPLPAGPHMEVFEGVFQLMVDEGISNVEHPTYRSVRRGANSRTVTLGSTYPDSPSGLMPTYIGNAQMPAVGEPTPVIPIPEYRKYRAGNNWISILLGGSYGNASTDLSSPQSWNNVGINYNTAGPGAYSVLSNIQFDGAELEGVNLMFASGAANTLYNMFDPWTYNYTVKVQPGTDSITVIPTTMSTNVKSIKLNGTEVAYKSVNEVAVVDGGVVAIDVTAPDGVTTSQYKFTITVDYPKPGSMPTANAPAKAGESNQLALSGYFRAPLPAQFADREVRYYIPGTAVIRQYFHFIAVPNGVNVDKFIVESGWKQIADETGECLFILMPKDGVWGSITDEKAYITAARAYHQATSANSTAGGATYFTTFGMYYLTGYKEGAAALEAWAADNTHLLIAQTYVGGASAGTAALEAAGATSFGWNHMTDGDTHLVDGKQGALVDMAARLKGSLNPGTAGFEGLLTKGDMPVPTWFVNAAGTESLTYWKKVNRATSATADSTLASFGGSAVIAGDVFAQKEDAWPTEYAGKISKVTSIATNADTDGYAFSRAIRDAMAKYTRYDNSISYGNALTYRLDYTAIQVERFQPSNLAKEASGKVKGMTLDGREVEAEITIKLLRTSGGISDMLVYVPETAGDKDIPVVIVNHGASQTAHLFFDSTAWWQTAAAEGVALLFTTRTTPSGTSGAQGTGGDLPLFDAMYSYLENDSRFDMTRIYTTGQSAGGGLTTTYTINRTDKLAATYAHNPPSLSSDAQLAAGGSKPIPIGLFIGDGNYSLRGVPGFAADTRRPGESGNVRSSAATAAGADIYWDNNDAFQRWVAFFSRINGLSGKLSNDIWYRGASVLNGGTDKEDGTLAEWGANNARFRTFTWSNDYGIRVMEYSYSLFNAHNNRQSYSAVIWDFMKHFSVVENGDGTVTRYYSESAFAKDDAVIIFPDILRFSVGAAAESDIAKDVEFTLSVSNAKNLLNVEVEFVVDGDMLAGKGIEPMNGFTLMNDVLWSYAGGNLWKGTATLAYPAGSSEGLMSAASVDIAKFVFAARAAGDATLQLTSVKAAGLVEPVTQYLDAIIGQGTATTNIDQRVFSKYDLNRDNVVDALDLGIMLLYCGFDKDSPNWDTLVKVNDSKGKGVTAKMCDVNGDGVIDMLDLLDLFIHYTK